MTRLTFSVRCSAEAAEGEASSRSFSAAAEADDSKDLMGGILRALLRSHEEGGGEEAEDEAEAAEGADANTTFVAAAEEEAEEAAEAAQAAAGLEAAAEASRGCRRCSSC